MLTSSTAGRRLNTFREDGARGPLIRFKLALPRSRMKSNEQDEAGHGCRPRDHLYTPALSNKA